MSANSKVALVVVAVVAVVIGVVVSLTRNGSEDNPAGAQPAALVREDSHRLSTAPDGKVTVVEFLDLECGACGAAFPGVERLRAEYGDRVTFVLRYFPIPSHRNAELAAAAVEAAGQQGKLEEMYRMMYETQPSWAGQQVSHRDTFVGFARELGLDTAKFEAALDDPATMARVHADRDDGVTVGVQGTPTFFVNGTVFTGPPSYEGLKSAIDRELAR
jgi:protein-disulfide isomerase